MRDMTLAELQQLKPGDTVWFNDGSHGFVCEQDKSGVPVRVERVEARSETVREYHASYPQGFWISARGQNGMHTLGFWPVHAVNPHEALAQALREAGIL